MDCGGGGSNFGGGHSSFSGGGCSSSGADFGGSNFGGSNFGGSNFGGMNTHTHNAHFATHSNNATTRWRTSTTASRPGYQSGTPTNCCGVVFLVIFFTCWFGIAGFMAVMAAINISPFAALPPICIALLGFFCFACTMYKNHKRQRELGGQVNLNQGAPAQPHVHPPPQQGAAPHSGYPSSYPTSQQPQWSSAYSTNYGQQQYGMAGQEAPRPSAPPSGTPGEDKPPSYDDVVKGGGNTVLGFV